jgi:protein TonB
MVAEDMPEIAPTSVAPLPIMIADEPADEPTIEATVLPTDEPTVKPTIEPAAPAPATVSPTYNPNRRFATALGSAAAPAPAKEIVGTPAKANRIVESKVAEPSATIPQAIATDESTAPAFSYTSTSDAPSFAALGEEDSSESGGKKKIMIAAVVVLALAALGYVGYETFNKPAPAVRHAVDAPQDSGQQPALRPMSSPVVSSPALAPSNTPDRASTTGPSSTPKIAATASREKPSAGAANSAPIRIASSGGTNSSTDSAPAPKQTEAPLRVKSNGTRKQSAADESAPQLPSELALASATENKLTGLISSSTPALPKAPLTTIKVSQGVSQGLLIKRVSPVYPHAALAIHAQGAVQIEATVNKEGRVVNPKVLSGDAVLAQAAIEAVRQWRYKPYYLDGEPVEIKTQITVKFKAD